MLVAHVACTPLWRWRGLLDALPDVVPRVPLGMGGNGVVRGRRGQQLGFTFGGYEPGVCHGEFQLLPLHFHTTPFPEEKSVLRVLYGVLLWAGMNAATPLGAWGRGSVMSLATTVATRAFAPRPYYTRHQAPSASHLTHQPATTAVSNTRRLAHESDTRPLARERLNGNRQERTFGDDWFRERQLANKTRKRPAPPHHSTPRATCSKVYSMVYLVHPAP